MSKQRRQDARRRKKVERKRSARMRVQLVKPDIHREIRLIQDCARAADSRIVKLGQLVLFSTRSRDAWLLDPDDDLALCVCRDGEPQPFRIQETSGYFAIEWTATFATEGPVFVAHERSGKVFEIDGYPTTEIAAACRG